MKCPKCGSEMLTLKRPINLHFSRLVNICIECWHEEKVGEDHNDPPLGSFPDDTPCPRCNTRCLLPSHGDTGIECPKCGWYKTVKECLAEKVGGDPSVH